MKQNSAFCSVLQGNPAVASPKEQLYEQMTSNPAFTERNIQKANAYLLYSRQEQKSLVTYHTLQSLYVCVWLVNTLTSTAPIGSPIICMWSPADICEQWDEFVFQFSRCSWGRNAWRTPKNVCVGGWWYQGTAWSGGIREILLLYPVVSRYSTIWFLWYNRDAVSLSYGIKIQHDLVSTV